MMRNLDVMSFEKVMVADTMTDAEIMQEFQKLADGKKSVLQH